MNEYHPLYSLQQRRKKGNTSQSRFSSHFRQVRAELTEFELKNKQTESKTSKSALPSTTKPLPPTSSRLTRISRIGHQDRYRHGPDDPECQRVILSRPLLILAELLLVLERKTRESLPRGGRVVLEVDDLGDLPYFDQDAPDRRKGSDLSSSGNKSVRRIWGAHIPLVKRIIFDVCSPLSSK
jgi:hypothetical protein